MPSLGRLLRNRRAGESTLAWHTPGLQTPVGLSLVSSTFEDGAPLPTRTAARPIGENISPALAWSGIPPETRQLVLLVEDCDVPFSRPIVHAAARFGPGVSQVGEGALEAGAAYGDSRAAFGRVGYHGPRPIPGHGPHHYVFQLFALDRPIPGDASLRPATVIQAMTGHVLARGRLTGTYER